MKILLSALSLYLCASAQANELGVVVNSNSFVQSERIRLEDIGQFTGFSAEELRNLKKVNLGNAPGLGETREYSRQALTEILRSKLTRYNIKGRRLKLQIPDVVVVRRLGPSFNEKNLRAELEAGLKTTCTECVFKIEDLQIPPSASGAMVGGWTLKTDFAKLKGPFNILVEGKGLSGVKSSTWVAGRISITKKVPVSTRVLSINDSLMEGDVKWESKDVTFLPDSTPVEAEIQGGKVKMSLAPGQIMTRSHLVRKQAVSRGESVVLTTGGSGWSVTLKGIAQEAGYLGDFVRVQNTESKRVVSGKVVAQGVVEVQ